MSKNKRIIDNPSSAEMIEQLQAFESLEALYKAIPFARKLFPKLEDVFEKFSDIKRQAEILSIPDRFNNTFSEYGWIAYESMNLEVMKKAVSLAESEGIDKAEIFLSEHYDEDTLKWGILRFNGNTEFRCRIRLAELAKADYLAERYHACIPLLLSMLDGIVNDVSKHVGFFAHSADMTAWDCIAAHETGLQSLAALMTKGRNKTNEDPITIPFRNGILHGRELAFDNRIVAAKCWASLFAARDWASAITEGKKTPKPKKEVSWRELLTQIAENGRQRKLLDAWKPRGESDLMYLPHSGEPSELPEDTPERSVAEFIDNWTNQRYGLMADALVYFTKETKGKKAGMAKEDFGRHVPKSFVITSVEDQAAAVSHVNAELVFMRDSSQIQKLVSVRTIYQDSQNNAMIRSEAGGKWKIIQNSFSDIIYALSL
ncbi:MAG: hypothetical protein DRH50_16220 [Deltaproteobacteria bacterium]|nr:MAG: hypothetical protein DRH50_16220 [Deltaproteobacteria bacterium]